MKAYNCYSSSKQNNEIKTKEYQSKSAEALEKVEQTKKVKSDIEVLFTLHTSYIKLGDSIYGKK